MFAALQALSFNEGVDQRTLARLLPSKGYSSWNCWLCWSVPIMSKAVLLAWSEHELFMPCSGWIALRGCDSICSPAGLLFRVNEQSSP